MNVSTVIFPQYSIWEHKLYDANQKEASFQATIYWIPLYRAKDNMNLKNMKDISFPCKKQVKLWPLYINSQDPQFQ